MWIIIIQYRQTKFIIVPNFQGRINFENLFFTRLQSNFLAFSREAKGTIKIFILALILKKELFEYSLFMGNFEPYSSTSIAHHIPFPQIPFHQHLP